MSSDRGSWWSITINNPTQLDYDKLRSPPAMVREMWYQTEIGQQGTKHIQLCLNTTYSRFGSIKLWLPTAHIELAREKAKLINYCRKSETSVAGTFVHWPDRPTENKIEEENDEDPAPSLNQILHTMTDYLTNDYVEKLMTPGTIAQSTDPDEFTYKHIVRTAYAAGKLKEADSFFGRNVKQAFTIAWRVFFARHLTDRQTEAVQEELAQIDNIMDYLPEYKSRCLISDD